MRRFVLDSISTSLINTWTLYNAEYVMPHRHEAVKTVPRCRGSEGQMCMFANSGKVVRAPPNTTTFTLLEL